MPLVLSSVARIAKLLVAFFLVGCASTRLIDAQVQSFAPHTVALGAGYQFEHLPSQAVNPGVQAQLERLAEPALAKVGLKRQSGAPLSVQISAVQRQESSTSQTDMAFGWGLGWVFGNGSIGIGNRGALFPGLDARPNYWRQVTLIMRNSAGVVVFESHASHEGPWADSEVILAAMLDAALQGFPRPPDGVRRVNIEIPR